MNPFYELIKLFGIEKNKINDNLMNTTISEKIKWNEVPEFKKIIDKMNKFSKRDRNIQIFLKDDSEESITIKENDNENKEEYDEFIKSCSELESDIIVEIDLKKDIECKKISIFNFESFINNFIKKSIIENLKFIDSRFKYENSIIFVNYDTEDMFYTNTIIMINNDNDLKNDDIDRSNIIEKCNSVSNFANNLEYKLLPEDFYIQTTNMNNVFTERFNEIKILFSLIYIADYASIDENNLKLKLNGYRNKDYNILLDEFKYKENYEEFYKIYKWIFQDSNECDKIALTRNVMSMYCKFSDILDIDKKTFLAIKSNYNIYLKENVDKYIELKRQLTEFVMNASREINDIIVNIVNNFQKNMVAFITFILGTIIANIVSDSPLNNIFTKDIITIIIAILLGSIIYLIVTMIETNYRVKSYQKRYDNLKKSYADILNENDIDMIFDRDKEYSDNIEEVKKVCYIFTVLWIMLLLCIFIIVMCNYNSAFIKKYIFKLAQILNLFK